MPFWLWPNVLSLDAPFVAVAWQALLSSVSGTPLRPVGRAILFLAVWLIYIVDRLLDVRRPAVVSEAARHRFYRSHGRGMTVLAVLISLVTAFLITLDLNPAVLRTGFITFVSVCLYFVMLHGTGARFPKEVSVALLFTMGTFLVAFARSHVPLSLLPLAAPFFVMCLANLVAIEHWEGRTVQWLDHTYLFWVLPLVLCPLIWPGPWSAAIALSSGALAALYIVGDRLGMGSRRAIVDVVLFVPPLFFL